MRKYTIAHSFLMITSVLASGPFHLIRRQGSIAIAAQTTQATSAQTTAAQSSPVSVPPTTISTPVTSSSSPSSPPPSSAPPSTSTTSAPTPTISTPATSSSTSTSTSVVLTSSSAPSTSPSSIQETTSASISTDARGSPVTVVVTESASLTTSSLSASATGATQGSPSHSSTIIGISVAGGIAAVGIIAFIIWKLTRKRFSDLDDSDEGIKWPELNRDRHTDLGNDGLSPQISNTHSAGAPSRNPSTFDQTEHLDPYAVPPLPQFNPNQPYRDDPHASSNVGYYDPYRGPIPQTLHHGSVDGHENIPMSTYPPRTRSPGPGMAFDMGGRGSPAPGRASPALGPAYDMGARASPAPGRTISPGPAAALGLDRRPTHDVQNAYNGPPDMAIRN